MTNQTQRGDYLAGESDGLEMDPNERETLDRVRGHLRNDDLWAEPPIDGQFRLLAAAAAEAAEQAGPAPVHSVPPTRMVEQAEAAGSEPDRGSSDETTALGEPVVDELAIRRTGGAGPTRRAAWFGGGALAAAAAVVIGFVAVDQLTDNGPTGDGAVVQEVAITATYDLRATDLDPDATASVDVKPTAAGVEFVLTLQGLDNAEGLDYYSAWLMSEDDAVPLGSFHWRKGGVPIVLWSGVDDPAYSRMAITRQQQGDRGLRSDEMVLMGAVPDLTAPPTLQSEPDDQGSD